MIELKESCEGCVGLDGDICYPQYGVAPHTCFRHIEGAKIGESVLLHQEEWPENFIQDPDAPGCGMWFCPTCKAGMEEYKKLFTTRTIPMTKQRQMKDFDQLTPLAFKVQEELPHESIQEHCSWYSDFVHRVTTDPEWKGAVTWLNGIGSVKGVIPVSFAEELLARNIDPYVEDEPIIVPPDTNAVDFNPVASYNLVKAGIAAEAAKPFTVYDEAKIPSIVRQTNAVLDELHKQEMDRRPGFWGRRKPIYQRISKAKYDRIIHGRAHRAIVETNPYFRVKQKINRLHGTAISCYVLFNRAYWYNKVTDQYMSMQLTGYTVGVDGFSLYEAHYASNRNTRDWSVIEFEWLLREWLVCYRDLETYKLHQGDYVKFGSIFEKIISESTNLELLEKVLTLTDKGFIKDTNPNLFT